MATRVSKSAAKQNIVALVDEFITLDDQIQKLEAVIKRHKKVKELLTEEATQTGQPDEEITLNGSTGHAVVFGACAETRSITDITGFRKAIGIDLFEKCVNPVLGKIDILVPEEVRESYIKKGYGNRRINTIIG